MTQPVLLFPGQGSQMPGMGRDAAEASSEAMSLWKRAESVSGMPLREIYWDGDDDAMSDTRALQPALTVVNLNLWREAAGHVRPLAAAGHSLGEFSALVAAGVLAPEAALEITALRGRLMAEADPDGRGGMAALLKLDVTQATEVTRAAAEESDEVLRIANYNTPAQFVISGTKGAVALACEKAKALKGRGVELSVSGAFHSPLMEKAAREFAPILRKAVWSKPRFPVYCNVHGKAVFDGESARDSLLQQMTSSVLWIDTIRNLYNDGARFWLEIGPKAVLGAMVGPCLKGIAPEGEERGTALIDSVESAHNFSL